MYSQAIDPTHPTWTASPIGAIAMRDDLRARYGEERLPRYTSYPTAPQFSDAVGHETYADGSAPSRPDAAVSLYLHIPFCRSMCWYCGCHTTITPAGRADPRLSRGAAPGDRLVAERLAAPLAGAASAFRRRHADHHGAGGVPRPDRRSCGERFASRRRRGDRGRDRSAHADRRHGRALWARRASTRASLGVQSFDPVVQRAINRIQSEEQTAHGGGRSAGGRRRAASIST